MPDKSEVIRAFVQAASAIPEVQLILLTGGADGGERVLTVIDAPRFASEFRHKVYRAELEALERFGAVPLDFVVYNLQEIAASVEEMIARHRTVLFLREQAA